MRAPALNPSPWRNPPTASPLGHPRIPFCLVWAHSQVDLTKFLHAGYSAPRRVSAVPSGQPSPRPDKSRAPAGFSRGAGTLTAVGGIAVAAEPAHADY
jgi:hypothetical protein